MSENSETVQKPWRFQPGQSGNVKGKPKGAVNHATRAALKLMHGQLKELTQTAIDKALEGDVVALRLVLDKVLPTCRERPIDPDVMVTPEHVDAVSAPLLMADIVRAVLAGQITPSEGERLMAMVERLAKVGTVDTPTSDGEPRAALPDSIREMIDQHQKRVYSEMLERKKGNHQSES